MKTNHDEPLWLTVSAACRRWGTGRTTFYRLVLEGKLLARKLGRRTLVHRPTGDAYFDDLPPLHQTKGV